ncbi:fumarylacetoacetate hydrolase family protein [Leisingera daeponensis]|uniref:fumarylacetoacetate hydrolase family protein n=1 Tax=Leisingera daeponensis TaxID=405746 RepID=UPI001C9616A6|nr:fumarylacetoacetate hydrolase family protein [Leisingera daeponensis]MBY6056911.1 fumarylacetoacetate hydrolase family protein [Leisingera daeponensis]
MSKVLFPLPDTPVVPVTGEAAGYPVGRIFCVGRNYAAHAAEMGNEVDREAPFYFTKAAANAVLSGAVVPYPPGTENFHYEMELAVAIESPVFRAAPNAALACVFGYCCALDMTRRDLQIRERQKQRPWDLGKDLENGTVLAPLTRSAAWGSPADQRIWLEVNGETRQDAKLSEMIWSVADIISHLSGFYHLRPGDLILTGTPAGVGPVNAGDKLRGEIDGLLPVSFELTDAE